jgi:hypothetical protein
MLPQERSLWQNASSVLGDSFTNFSSIETYTPRKEQDRLQVTDRCRERARVRVRSVNVDKWQLSSTSTSCERDEKENGKSAGHTCSAAMDQR